MKNLQLKSFTLFAGISCLLISSCDNKKHTENQTNKKDMNAETQTLDNMQDAYKGEKTATAKYEAFSVKAEAEGFHNIALLYKAVSAAENIHASNHKIVIEDDGSLVPNIIPEYKVKTTKENLYNGVNGEVYESKTMYPNFIKTAEKAHNLTAVLSLTYAMKTEIKHNAFFELALSALNKDNVQNLPNKYFVCPVCGNTYSTSAPKHCDFSLTDGSKFIVFE